MITYSTLIKALYLPDPEVVRLADGRIRIQDVAARAGVSAATVSLVLSERFHTRVSAGTAQRVRAAAEELGYESADKISELEWLTVVVDATAPQRLLDDALAGVLQEARREAYAVVVVPVGSGARATRAVATTIGRVPRQRVACIALSDAIDGWGLRLPESTLVVTLDDGGPSDHMHRYPRVVPESEPAARKLARVLAQRGHQAVAVASYGPAAAVATWTRSMEGAGLQVSGHVDVAPAGASRAEGELRRLLVEGHENRRTTAVICLDPRVVGVIRAVVEGNGLRVPQDVAVVVEDDGRAHDVDQLLPTSAFPAREMGRVAARLLLDDSSGGRARPRAVVRVPRTVTGDRRIQRAVTGPEDSLDLLR